MKKLFFLLVLTLTVLFWGRESLLGMFLEPKIERKLTEIFGMPLEIQSFRFDPLTGEFGAESVRLANLPPYSETPHIDIHGVQGRVRLFNAGAIHGENSAASLHELPLLQKQVFIDRVMIERLDYRIERQFLDGKPTTNAWKMVHAIKEFRRKRRAAPHPNPLPSARKSADPSSGGEGEGRVRGNRGWEVAIGEIVFQDGFFVYSDQTAEGGENKYIFQGLNGALKGLRWPTNPSLLSQELKLSGQFGELHPVPFSIEGQANFATGQISFDLRGEIEEGPMEEYERWWSGLPIRFREGSFRVSAHAVCQRKSLKAENTLVLHALKLAPDTSIPGKIWGMPVVAAVKFLEDEEEITLNIPLEGQIADPKFEIGRAFRAAFQESLKQHTVGGLDLIVGGASRLANTVGAGLKPAPTLAIKASEKIAGGVEQVTTTLLKNSAETLEKVVPKAEGGENQ